MFCYFAHLNAPFAKIDTFGNILESRDSVKILNQEFGDYITFHLGDSRTTLSNFCPAYQIDFAWVDGGHDLETCSSDLLNCDRLRIPRILVDDYRGIEEVKKAVDQFVSVHDYKIVSATGAEDNRGIVYLVRGAMI